MSVEITPAAQMGFHRPLTRLVTQTIKIHNPHPHPVAFKVKTTAPKQYCVRPNSGRVESGESVEVQVLLQPLAVDPPPHAKCKDKFLVQSAFITPDEEMHTLSEMWSATEANNKGAIQEQKIKCVYLAAEDGRAENGIKEEEEEGMESRVMDESTLFTAAQSSPAPKANGNSTDRSAALASPIEQPTQAAPIGATGTGVSPTNSALEKSLEVATTDKQKLELAMAEIERLRAQLKSPGAGETDASAEGPTVTGLRRRGGAAASQAKEGAEVMVEKAKEAVSSGGQGVPVEVVAALVIGVFVMTYLFF
ncbi:PapD-like protein [Dioszegia hungarica]|uniref:PapD-like protein n=1 Tax=Dioszegia hungarica TaxID=4972 RepID=A0AA38HBB4_9TREE|nr:PapD-like protein [Dioszegia hungarica]KAI9636041.1 PapD-like protein [Dioszegia hungarica]